MTGQVDSHKRQNLISSISQTGNLVNIHKNTLVKQAQSKGDSALDSKKRVAEFMGHIKDALYNPDVKFRNPFRAKGRDLLHAVRQHELKCHNLREIDLQEKVEIAREQYIEAKLAELTEGV